MASAWSDEQNAVFSGLCRTLKFDWMAVSAALRQLAATEGLLSKLTEEELSADVCRLRWTALYTETALAAQPMDISPMPSPMSKHVVIESDEGDQDTFNILQSNGTTVAEIIDSLHAEIPSSLSFSDDDEDATADLLDDPASELVPVVLHHRDVYNEVEEATVVDPIVGVPLHVEKKREVVEDVSVEVPKDVLETLPGKHHHHHLHPGRSESWRDFLTGEGKEGLPNIPACEKSHEKTPSEVVREGEKVDQGNQ